MYLEVLLKTKSVWLVKIAPRACVEIVVSVDIVVSAGNRGTFCLAN